MCDIDEDENENMNNAIAVSVILWILFVMIFMWWLFSLPLALLSGIFIFAILSTINVLQVRREQKKKQDD